VAERRPFGHSDLPALPPAPAASPRLRRAGCKEQRSAEYWRYSSERRRIRGGAGELCSAAPGAGGVEPSQYRPWPKAGSFRRETWQPLTRLAALGDLSPLRSAPRGEVVSGQGSTEGGRPGSARHATPGGYASGAHALPCEARGRARLQSLTRFLFLDCVRAVRRTSARISRSPSLSMRQLRVDGLSPRMTAAPPVPVMRPCVWCKTSAM